MASYFQGGFAHCKPDSWLRKISKRLRPSSSFTLRASGQFLAKGRLPFATCAGMQHSEALESAAYLHVLHTLHALNEASSPFTSKLLHACPDAERCSMPLSREG